MFNRYEQSKKERLGGEIILDALRFCIISWFLTSQPTNRKTITMLWYNAVSKYAYTTLGKASSD